MGDIEIAKPMVSEPEEFDDSSAPKTNYLCIRGAKSKILSGSYAAVYHGWGRGRRYPQPVSGSYKLMDVLADTLWYCINV